MVPLLRADFIEADKNHWNLAGFLPQRGPQVVATFGQGFPLNAFGQWYSYDPASHGVGIIPGNIYVLYNSGTHQVFKVELTGYDNGAYELRWGPLT